MQRAIQALENPTNARAWLLLNLKASVEAGNTQAAKEIRDILNIASNEQELEINHIHYRSMCIDCPIQRPPLLPHELEAIEQDVK